MRTTPPSSTIDSAKLLDGALYETVIRLLGNDEILQLGRDPRVDEILDRLFLPIGLGGMGIINSESTCQAAFLASFSSAAYYMRQKELDPRPSFDDPNVSTRSLDEISRALKTLIKSTDDTLKDVTLDSIWTTSFVKLQRTICRSLAMKRRERILRRVSPLQLEGSFKTQTTRIAPIKERVLWKALYGYFNLIR